jgi:UDP-2,4-diacetamido-2,4,6-trideoxy-beta-L-altropyranose hydrolase
MQSSTFAFRVDASEAIGTGHVVRCLTLAKSLTERGAQCFFICRQQPGNLIEYIRDQGFLVFPINPPILGGTRQTSQTHEDLRTTTQVLYKKNVDWLIIDHYKIDIEWEMKIRPICKKIMVIDDLANRHHDCDILLDQNLRRHAQSRYEALVPENCQLFLGPQYVLLRKEFENNYRLRTGIIRHVLVYFGGNDKYNLALHTLKALSNFPMLTADIVLGFDHPFHEEVHRASSVNLKVHDVVEMADAMNRADLAIGVCGMAAWERCAMGLPSLVCITAENQREDAEKLHELGAVHNLGEQHEIDDSSMTRAIERALNHPKKNIRMGNAARKVVSGYIDKNTELLNTLLTKRQLYLDYCFKPHFSEHISEFK